MTDKEGPVIPFQPSPRLAGWASSSPQLSAAIQSRLQEQFQGEDPLAVLEWTLLAILGGAPLLAGERADLATALRTTREIRTRQGANP